MFGVKKTDNVKIKSSKEITDSIFGIGLEKLDRDMYDPKNAYPYLEKCGVKYARIQSGWARTEKEKGVYDFLWLDKIVDNLVDRGIEPWITLCYGNALYTKKAKDYFYGVGCPPINSEEELSAWCNYCKEVVKRYKGKVSKYEIWNEPDGDWCWVNGQNPIEYGNFAITTAKAIREANKNAYIIGGSMAFLNAEWLDKMLSTGLNKYIDAVSYHRYTANLEKGVLELIKPFREVLNKYNVKDLIQGESGCQSEPFGNGALWEGAWSPEKQTKILLRRELIDLMTDVKFCSYFCSVDVNEALIGVTGKAYFGVLKNVYDKKGNLTNKYAPKPSYYALQTVCSTLSGAKPVEHEIEFVPEWSLKYYSSDEDGKDFIYSFFKKGKGLGFCYYKPTNVMTTDFSGTTSFKIKTKLKNPKLIDLYDGSIYEFEKEYLEYKDNEYHFKNIPVKDYPLLITFGDFI